MPIKLLDDAGLLFDAGFASGEKQAAAEIERWRDGYEIQMRRVDALEEEVERLRGAIKDAHALIDNALVGPWVAAHSLDDVLSR